jgi:hypothetical protein
MANPIYTAHINEKIPYGRMKWIRVVHEKGFLCIRMNGRGAGDWRQGEGTSFNNSRGKRKGGGGKKA